jgi:hypothetical protein
MEKKIIQINTDFFKPVESVRRNRTKKRITEPAPPKNINNKLLKQRLLQKIRDKQRANEKENHDENNDIGMEEEDDTGVGAGNEFDDSMKYFENMMRQNNRPLSKTQKQDPLVNSNIPRELYTTPFAVAAAAPPPGLLPVIGYVQPRSQPQSQSQSQFQPQPQPQSQHPQYGCLKGGSLPTYRTWTLRNNTTTETIPSIASAAPTAATTPYHYSPPNMTTPTPRLPPTENRENREDGGFIQRLEKERLHNLITHRETENVRENILPPTTQRRTIKRTYQVGKSKIHPNVSVLLSNKTIRKRIVTETQKINQLPIHEVKHFLQKKGFIKIGSSAPNNILRKMYESAILMGGDIVNHNKDTLIHNFLQAATEN